MNLLSLKKKVSIFALFIIEQNWTFFKKVKTHFLSAIKHFPPNLLFMNIFFCSNLFLHDFSQTRKFEQNLFETSHFIALFYRNSFRKKKQILYFSNLSENQEKCYKLFKIALLLCFACKILGSLESMYLILARSAPFLLILFVVSIFLKTQSHFTVLV